MFTPNHGTGDAYVYASNEVASFFLRFEEAAAVLKYIAGRWGLTRRSIKDESSLVETCIERFDVEVRQYIYTECGRMWSMHQ